MITKSIFAIWHPTEITLERFQALHDILEAKDKARVEVRMSFIVNEIYPLYGVNAQIFLSNWQKSFQLLKGVSMALFRPYPISDTDITSTMPMSFTEHLAVQIKGVISNFSEIRQDLSFYGYSQSIQMVDDVILLLLNHYLEIERMSPVDAVKRLMKRLKGRFILMALITEGECLMVGCRDESLIIGKGNPTVYFGTDFDTVAHFSKSSISVVDSALFCLTPFQSEMPPPIIID